MNGKFVVIEGPDGCGKSSAIECLKSTYKDAVFVKDPGGTKIGQQIRKILLDENNKEMCRSTELMLYRASREQLIHEIIVPSLKEGKLVISDRWDLSTKIYQNADDDYELNVEPDLMIILTASLDIMMQRMDGTDRMESKGKGFFKRILQEYIDFAWEFDKRKHKLEYIDTSHKTIKEVVDLIKSSVEGLK